MDLLRLAGVSGVGKSTTAWAVARSFAADGLASAYVDIDQLGMCYPAPDDDPDRWALKERALASIADQFALSGVERLIVAGVAWPDDPPPQIQGVSVQSLWLDASEQTRRARLVARGESDEKMRRYLTAGTAEAERVNAAWARVRTDDFSEDEVVDHVIARWHPVTPHEESQRFTPRARSVRSSRDRALWITGPRLAETSRVGWEIASQEWSAGRRAGFMDLTQLSFAWNIDDAAVGMANLARLHQEFCELGTEMSVVVAPPEVGPEAARAVLPASNVSFVRLEPTSTG